MTLVIHRRFVIIIWTGLNIKIPRHSSKIIWVIKLFFCQNWRIILAKDQIGHSYTFWTMPVSIFSPVQIIMGHPLLAHPDSICFRQLCSQVYIFVIFLRSTYLFTTYLWSLLLINSITGKKFTHAVCVIFNKGHHTPFSNVNYLDLKKLIWMTEGMFFTLGRNRISGRKNIWP